MYTFSSRQLTWMFLCFFVSHSFSNFSNGFRFCHKQVCAFPPPTIISVCRLHWAELESLAWSPHSNSQFLFVPRTPPVSLNLFISSVLISYGTTLYPTHYLLTCFVVVHVFCCQLTPRWPSRAFFLAPFILGYFEGSPAIPIFNNSWPFPHFSFRFYVFNPRVWANLVITQYLQHSLLYIGFPFVFFFLTTFNHISHVFPHPH